MRKHRPACPHRRRHRRRHYRLASPCWDLEYLRLTRHLRLVTASRWKVVERLPTHPMHRPTRHRSGCPYHQHSRRHLGCRSCHQHRHRRLDCRLPLRRLRRRHSHHRHWRPRCLGFHLPRLRSHPDSRIDPQRRSCRPSSPMSHRCCRTDRALRACSSHRSYPRLHRSDRLGWSARLE